jgi:hypothetical protein
VLDDICFVTIEATDKDMKNEMTLVEQIKIIVIAQKFKGVPIENSEKIAAPSGDPPAIVKSFVNRGGLSSIVFS